VEAPAVAARRALSDCCTSCCRLNPPLVVAEDDENGAVIGCYKCRFCSATWWTSYARSAL
jgi:hypothetical protein